jgi:Ca2+-binding EF-hand superfamily protein
MKYHLILLSCAALASTGALADDSKSGKGATSTFEALDKDADGKLSQEEVAGNDTLSSNFAKLDANSDGFVSKGEFRRNTMRKRDSSSGY